MDSKTQLQELIREQPYFIEKKEAVFFQWLDKLLEASPLEPNKYYKTNEARRKKVLPWMKALIKDEPLNKELAKNIERGAKPNFFSLGELNEWRSSLALTVLKAKQAINDFTFPGTSSLNDSLGIDLLVQLKSAQGKKRRLPIQIKSSNHGGSRTIQFYRTENFYKQISLASKKIEGYLKRNNNEGKMRRLIPCFKVRSLSITDIADITKMTIKSYGRKKLVLRTDGDFNDKSRHEKIVELIKSGFFINLVKEEQRQ